MADYHEVEVDNYSREEVTNLLSYFKQKKWITKGMLILLANLVYYSWDGLDAVKPLFNHYFAPNNNGEVALFEVDSKKD